MSVAIEEDLVTWLKADTTITGLVGQRIGPQTNDPGDAEPRISYQRISADRWFSQGPFAPVRQVRIQINIDARTQAAAVAVSNAIIGTAASPRLDGLRGTFGSRTVQAIRCVDERDEYTPPSDLSSTGYFRRSLDFLFTFQGQG